MGNNNELKYITEEELDKIFKFWPFNLLHEIFGVNIDCIYTNINNIHTVLTAPDLLSEKELDVILYRFKSYMIFSDIAKRVNVTKQRVAELQNHAIFKLRRIMNFDLKSIDYRTYNEINGKYNALLKSYNELEKYEIIGEDIKEKNKSEMYRDINIATLRPKMSNRLFNCLYRGDIHTVYDLINMDIYRAMKIRNFGLKTFKELLIILSANDLTLKRVRNRKYECEGILNASKLYIELIGKSPFIEEEEE